MAKDDDALERQILLILAECPDLPVKKLAERVGKDRRTCKRCIDRLIDTGRVLPMGYHLPLAKNQHNNIPLGMVLITSPQGSEQIKLLEQHLNEAEDIGTWTFINGDHYDYIFVLLILSDDGRLYPFIDRIRSLGAITGTWFTMAKSRIQAD